MIRLPKPLLEELKREAKKRKTLSGRVPPLWEIVAMWREGWMANQATLTK